MTKTLECPSELREELTDRLGREPTPVEIELATVVRALARTVRKLEECLDRLESMLDGNGRTPPGGPRFDRPEGRVASGEDDRTEAQG